MGGFNSSGSFSDDEMNFDYKPQWGDYTEYERSIISDRFKNIVFLFELFQKKLPEAYGKLIRLNYQQLYLACGFYVNDLKEVRSFHLSKGVGPVRRAAFLSRQVARIRPIETSVLRKNDYPDRNLLRALTKFVGEVNSLFALRVFESYLGITEKLAESNMYKNLENDMIFLFQFRDTPREALVAKAKLLQELNS